MRFAVLFGAVLSCWVLGCGSGDDDSSAAGGSGGSSGGAGTGSGATGGGAGMATGGTAGGAGAGATGGSAGAAGTAALDAPSDTTQAGLQAFIDAGSYRSDSWASAMTAPSPPPSDSLSPHGLEHIFYNHALRQSKADGHAGVAGDAFGVGSMAVKEIYTGDAVVGHAAMLRTSSSWIFFCVSSESDRCYSGAPAGELHYSTSISNCACHGGGTVVSGSTAPPP